MPELISIAIMAILTSNIVSFAGVGAISLQSEKRSFKFMLISSISVITIFVLTGMMTFVFEKFVLVPLNAEFLKLYIIVLIVVVFAFIEKIILKKASREIYFLYEKSYSLPITVAVVVGSVLMVDFSFSFGLVMFELAMFSVGYVLVQVIFYALFERLDNTKVLKPARNVPLMLFTLSIVGMILYAVSLFF